MAGTRTAPSISATDPVYIAISFHLIDAGGDKRSVSLKANPTNATDANIEDAAAKLQTASNASVWKVEVSEIYAGAASAANADDSVFESVYDNVVILYKDDTVPVSQNGFVPAPIGSMISDDVVDTTNTTYTDIRDALETLLNDDYQAISVRYTERRDKNDSIPA